MEGLSGVVFLLVMGLVWLISQVAQHRSRPGAKTDPAQPVDEEQAQVADEEAAEQIARMRPGEPRPAPRPRRMSDLQRIQPPLETRSPVRRLFAGRDNLRRAVIVMTVLGPPVSERTESKP